MGPLKRKPLTRAATAPKRARAKRRKPAKKPSSSRKQRKLVWKPAKNTPVCTRADPRAIAERSKVWGPEPPTQPRKLPKRCTAAQFYFAAGKQKQDVLGKGKGKRFWVTEGGLSDAKAAARLEEDLVLAHKEVKPYAHLNRKRMYDVVYGFPNSTRIGRLEEWKRYLSDDTPYLQRWRTLMLWDSTAGPSGLPIGMIHYCIPGDDADHFLCSHLSVAPQYRCRGLGRILFQYCMKKLHPRSEWQLEVISRAMTLYRRLGFKHVLEKRVPKGLWWYVMSTRKPRSLQKKAKKTVGERARRASA